MPRMVEDGTDVAVAAPPLRTYPLHEEPADALVICCADPRFLDAIDKFLEDEGIVNPAMVIVPGSVKSIGLQGFIPGDWKTLRHQLELMATRNAHVPRVVLFTHDECRSYAASEKLFRRIRNFVSVSDAQRSHLVAVAKFLKEQFLPGARFELYHAAIVPDGHLRGVQFRRITA
jgi:hypothetical protein